MEESRYPNGFGRNMRWFYMPCQTNAELDLEKVDDLPLDLNEENAFDKLKDYGLTMGYVCPQGDQLFDEGEIYEGEFGKHAATEEDGPWRHESYDV